MSKWEWKKLKDICEKGSSNIKQSDLKDLTGDYPIFGASGYIQNVDFYQRDRDYIGIIKDGSGVGRTMLLPAFSSVIGTLQYILPKEGNDIKFINYALQNIDFSKSVQGAAIPHIYFKDYGETEILVPPLSEQKRIVKFLDEEFSKIDTLKTNTETNLKNAKELFESELRKTFGNPIWKKKNFSDLFKLKSGEYLNSKDISEGEYPVYGGNGIIAFHNKYNLNGANVIIGRVGALCGNVRFISDPIWLTDNAFRIVFQTDEIDCLFATYLLNFLNLRSYARQAAQPVISNASLKDVSIPLPPLSVQKEIVARLDKLSENVKRLEANYKQIIANCDELKKSILKKTFEGDSRSSRE